MPCNIQLTTEGALVNATLLMRKLDPEPAESAHKALWGCDPGASAKADFFAEFGREVALSNPCEFPNSELDPLMYTLEI